MLNNKKDPISAIASYRMESTLRSVDLNLLTVFDAVMQEQNITRAAHNLGMSQPAVSNAVARLKVMFNDELFMRQGRGIQPTQRARQLFGPIRQALQLIRNELPSSVFSPESSTRLFKLAICSPCDIRFAPKIMASIHEQAPHVQLHLDAEFDRKLAERMRYQEIDFVIDYARFDEQGFSSTEIFQDELVVVAAKSHPRIQGEITREVLANEQHAKLSKVHGQRSFSEQAYRDLDCHPSYEGTSLSNVLYVVGQSELVTIAPRWMVEHAANKEQLQILAFPFENACINGYLSWHESSEKDKGHIWLRDQLMVTCGEVVALK
ncbi:transcriptional regulator LeuO [Vibrio cincinnatiensis]|jgi:LysR family transcriptional activator for leuABCD operon|uniref:LysR family transcriptional regulator, transcriptional activator for leuABCD operon n=1 Tax=Vibrio cincinnatiensis DSM 19608 TaxID=1123491 RepID=A0A1T4P890_VIBCI|nr:transcriptional regulator LeuO [Vibrio cincinnatiensis]MCG3723411.1 transcriptional regulator LeuO [Vibrio cincinnatiensis]MCG3731393.1 transcriptional regulator LeuO [Vibrio cincinnatiensis]MCG3735225.1 transcriptional regulator LeuO [Vibrio cincinnatiensis]MCG3739088.1 transcriptional regulator LeuO [Vibrio cincinnatiensis]MCG3742472.1 transcriptional regulator LeuO [Vibrio cincinnatiensis]